MIRRPPRSTLFPTRRSSDLAGHVNAVAAGVDVQGGGPTRRLVDYELQLGRLKQVLLGGDRKSTRLNSSHANISYAVFCLKKKKKKKDIYNDNTKQNVT